MVLGCHRADPDSGTDALLVGPEVFSKWPSATTEPIEVAHRTSRLCGGTLMSEEELKDIAEQEIYGPHAKFLNIVRVNPEATDQFFSGKTLPVGAVVVKEKHRRDASGDAFDAYALMIKREAGYDTRNGDWEYAYISLQPEKSISRGRLKACAECHAKAADRDFLFHSYLVDETD